MKMSKVGQRVLAEMQEKYTARVQIKFFNPPNPCKVDGRVGGYTVAHRNGGSPWSRCGND